MGTGRRLQLPVRRGPLGPISARLQRRWVVGYFALWAGSLVLGRRSSKRARTRAAGVMLPGGGYLATGRIGRFMLSLFGTVFGVLVWFLAGTMWAPFAVWALAAKLAARRRGGRSATSAGWRVTAAAGPALLGLTWAAQRVAFRRDSQRADEKNAWLARHVYVDPTPQSSRAPAGAELTPDQLQYQRFILDRALQPIDRFDGFLWLDQFRESAVRYQLNYAQWSLALAQYRCTPAFQGYVAEAQRCLIEKMTYRRIWEYWRWENLWGNFRFDADPIRRDNVMLSGYYGLMLGVFETVTGDQRYHEPGSLEFRWNARKAFPYDASSIVGTVYRNMNRARYCAFPCEPNWVYVTCNIIAMASLVAHDRLHDTDYSEQLLPRFRDSVELEFLTTDGRPMTHRASRAGIALPGLTASTGNEAGTVFWLSPTLHDVATRTWVLIRDHIVRGDEGPLAQSAADRIDFGNYRLTWGPIMYAMAMAAAREMGDTEAYDSVEASLARIIDREPANADAPYPGTIVANLWMGPGVFGGERAWHDLINYGLPKEQHDWPRLAEAPYPDVLVAKAVSDGRALDLVLQPGAAAGRVALGLANLVPGRRYAVHGPQHADFEAGHDGTALLRIDLTDRTELTVAPL